MVHTLARATVDDFDEWKTHFAENDAFRTEQGQRGYQAFRSLDDPNEVLVLFEFDNREEAEAMFDSEEFKRRLKEAGVQGTPERAVFEKFDEKVRTTPSA